MNILLIEDEDEKFNAINAQILLLYPDADVKRVEYYGSAVTEIHNIRYDLIVFDIFVPVSKTITEEKDLSKDLIQEYINSKYNYNSDAIVITKLDTTSYVEEFNKYGVTVVSFTNEALWKEPLSKILKKVSSNHKSDFLIFCALSEEMIAYKYVKDVNLKDMNLIKEIKSYPIEIGKHKGLIIIPKRMGVIDMAVVSAKAIDYFQPKIVAMSGICAGFEDQAKFLDIIIGNPVWFSSNGKVYNSIIKTEIYQIQIDNKLDNLINKVISNVKGKSFDLGLESFSYNDIKIAPFVSSPYVVSSEDAMKQLTGIHRKVAALDMEAISLYEAASQAVCKPLFFVAKSVVDLGDSNKNDDLHKKGAFLSADFVTSVIKEYLNSNS